MCTFTIRPATPEDCEAIATLAKSAYAHFVSRMDKKPAPITEDYAARIRDNQVFVLDDGSGVVKGFLVLEPGSDGMLLDNVAVSPEAQGRGYGKALIGYAVEQAKTLGYTKLTLYTNEVMVENIRLYTRLGFSETRRASHEGYNRVFMTKNLV